MKKILKTFFFVKQPKDEDDDAAVEEEKEEEDKPKTKKVQKTTWDWELINNHKPIWTRKPAEIEEEEYRQGYRLIQNFITRGQSCTDFVFFQLKWVPPKMGVSQNFIEHKPSLKTHIN